MFDNKLMTVVVGMAAGALSQAITFGTYDHFKSKGYSGWKAGAVSGGLISGASLLAIMALKGTETEATVTSGCLSGGCSGTAGVTLTKIPGALGYLTAQQLNGITVQQLSGITVDPLGALPRSAQKRQTISRRTKDPRQYMRYRKYAQRSPKRFRIV